MQQALLDSLKARPRRWLLTGSAGFIGSNLLEVLLRSGQEVVSLDNFATGHRRNLDQVVRSQRAMLDRLELGGEPHPSSPSARLETDARRALAEHIVELETWLETAHHMRVLGVSYERVLAQPAVEIDRVARFLELDLDRAAMLRAIEPALQRQQ